MIEFINQKDIQHVGEIVLVGPSLDQQQMFIRAICPEVISTTHDTVFGSARITDELSLFMYGVGFDQTPDTFAWDLIARKMLGYIIVFEWFNKDSFKQAQIIIDSLSEQFEAPALLAADLGGHPSPVGGGMFEHGMSLAPRIKFLFWDSNNTSSAHAVVAALLDSVINEIT